MTAPPLKGKVAIVTGGGRGLGRAMTYGLARAGAHVVATASQGLNELDDLERAASREPGSGKVVPVAGDVTSEADCRRVTGAAWDRFGRLDVLVNNAGRGMKFVSETFMSKPTQFWEVEPDIWRMIIDTNVNGPFLMSREAVPCMLATGAGRIVNISMNAATIVRRGFSPYGPSKAALKSETTIWAQDLNETPITVNMLLPGGAAATGMIPAQVPDSVRGSLLAPDVMVPPLIWLASDLSAGVTGQRIVATEWSDALAARLLADKSSGAQQ